MIFTCMPIKNPLMRFARCRKFDSPDGCDHFEWIDDSVYDKVRSMVVSLNMLNKTLLEVNQQLHSINEERACEKEV